MSALPDRIELRGIRVLGTHGVLAHEQARPQPFEVDLDVEVDLSRAGRSDDLADSVDYGALVEDVIAVVGGTSRRLLESLAESIAAAVLARPGVRAVAVALRKLRPPLAAFVDTSGVRIVRHAQPRPLVGEKAASGPAHRQAG